MRRILSNVRGIANQCNDILIDTDAVDFDRSTVIYFGGDVQVRAGGYYFDTFLLSAALLPRSQLNDATREKARKAHAERAAWGERKERDSNKNG